MGVRRLVVVRVEAADRHRPPHVAHLARELAPYGDVVIADAAAPEPDAAGYDEVLTVPTSMLGPLGPLDEVLERVRPPWTLTGDGRCTLRPTEATSAPVEVVFPSEAGVVRPGVDDAAELLAAGLPLVDRAFATRDPLDADRSAAVGADALTLVRAAGYPDALLWPALAAAAPPRDVAVNTVAYRVLPTTGEAPATTWRSAVCVHVWYVDQADDLLARARHVPEPRHVIVTTDTEAKAASLRAALTRHRLDGEVRLVTTNDGRDVSAFLLDCADVLAPGRFDLVWKLHSKRSPQDPPTVARWFATVLLDSLVPTASYAARLVAAFEADPAVGLAIPPTVHMGYPTLGHAWFGNRDVAAGLARRMGVRVRFDPSTPLAPYGSMYVARPEALAPLLAAGIEAGEYPAAGRYGDGSLAHAVERLVGYAAVGSGYRVLTVMPPHVAEVSYAFLEHKLQALQAHLPEAAADGVRWLRRVPRPPSPSVAVQRLAAHHPGLAAWLRALADRLRRRRRHGTVPTR